MGEQSKNQVCFKRKNNQVLSCCWPDKPLWAVTEVNTLSGKGFPPQILLHFSPGSNADLYWSPEQEHHGRKVVSSHVLNYKRILVYCNLCLVFIVLVIVWFDYDWGSHNANCDISSIKCGYKWGVGGTLVAKQVGHTPCSCSIPLAPARDLCCMSYCFFLSLVSFLYLYLLCIKRK